MDNNELNNNNVMDDNLNSALFAFDSPLNQSSYIKVIGVGGGGNNAVNHMYQRGISGVDFIVSNTDMKALNNSPVPNKLALGSAGLGAGGRPSKARRAAEMKEAEIKELLAGNTKMLFITAGMGGGTGTGAAPVIARFAKEVELCDEDDDEPAKVLVVAVVTTPFLFEGSRRLQQAREGVEELRKYVDSILIINNEKLRGYGNLVMSDAFAMADDVLLTAVKGIAEIITLNAYVNIDFRDVNTVMENSGTALMGIGEGQGENRARQAVEQATTSVLLNDNDIAGAKNVLLYFAYGPDHEITMDEMGEVTNYVTQRTGSMETNVIWGTGFDQDLGDKVKITLIATGFEQKERAAPVVHQLPPERPAAPEPNSRTGAGEPHIVRPPEPEAPLPAQGTDAGPRGAAGTETLPEAGKEPAGAPQPDAAKPRRVIPLDGGPAEPEKPHAHDSADDGIVVVGHGASAETPAPVAAPAAPRPAVEPAAGRQSGPCGPLHPMQPPSPLDIQAMDRADRIKAMHDMLRNNPNGAAIVESMNAAELTGERIYRAAHSSESEAGRSSMSADGKVSANDFLYGTVD